MNLLAHLSTKRSKQGARGFPWPLVVLMLMACSWTASAATLAGTVRNEVGGGALGFANIILTTPEGTPLNGLGESDGRFSFEGLAPGLYSLRVLYVGFETFETSVTLGASGERILEVALMPRSFELEPVVVEATALPSDRELGTGVLSFDAELLSGLTGVVENDPIRSLQLLPGVQAASDISSGLYVRGGAPDQTLVLLDGVTVFNPTHAFGLFSTFNPDAVGDVTLYKGAYPAEYGGRLGAVLDVESQQLDDSTPRGKIGLSTIALRGTVNGILGLNRWQFSGRRSILDPILDVARKQNSQIPSYYFYDLNAKLQTKRGWGWLDVTAYQGRDDIRLDADQDTFFDIVWGNRILSAEARRVLGGYGLGRLRASYSEYESGTRAEILSTKVSTANRLREISLQAEIDWAPLARHEIGSGLQLSAYRFSYEESFNAEEPERFETEPVELSFFLQDRWRPVAGATLLAGLRLRTLSEGDRVFLEPRLSISQDLGSAFRLKYGGGLFNQTLQLVSTEGFSAGDYYVPLDSSVEPGNSWQSVLGLEWLPDETYRVSVEAYYTRLANLLDLDNQAAVDQGSYVAEDLFNSGGKGYASGAEFFVERRRGNLTGWIGYTLGWTRRSFEEINGGEEFAPKYDRRHDLKAVFNLRRGKWSYGGSFVYASGQAFTPAAARYTLRDPATGIVTDESLLLPAAKNSARLLPYHRLDLTVGRDFSLFGKKAEGRLQIFNVTNRSNEWFVQYSLEDGRAEAQVFTMLPIIPSLGVNIEF